MRFLVSPNPTSCTGMPLYLHCALTVLQNLDQDVASSPCTFKKSSAILATQTSDFSQNAMFPSASIRAACIFLFKAFPSSPSMIAYPHATAYSVPSSLLTLKQPVLRPGGKHLTVTSRKHLSLSPNSSETCFPATLQLLLYTTGTATVYMREEGLHDSAKENSLQQDNLFSAIALYASRIV